MAHILDSNVFIEAYQRHYGFDICPGFWEWLKLKNADGEIFSIDRVLNELKDRADDLSIWANGLGSSFFLPIDGATNAAMITVVNWIKGQPYKPEGFNVFMNGADPFLVAYALAHNHTVVTHERLTGGPQPGQVTIKIPDVCQGMGIACKDPFTMLRELGASFVMPSS